MVYLSLSANVCHFLPLLLLQTRDVLVRIMRDQEAHYGLRLGAQAPQQRSSAGGEKDGSSGDDDAAPSASPDELLDVEGVKTATLRRVLDIVYASAFPELADQQHVRDLIARHFSYGMASSSEAGQVPASTTGNQNEELPAIDTSVPGVVRMGSIYMERGEASVGYRHRMHGYLPDRPTSIVPFA